MNQRRDFQETDRPSFYSGRKIRRAVEQPQYQEESPVRDEVSHRHEELSSHEEPSSSSVPVRETRRIQQVRQESPRHMHQTNNQTANDPKAKLVRSLERNLTDSSQKHLIGVFGMNSDNTIANALRELNNSMYGNFYVLQSSRLIDDVFTMFASAMLNFLESNSNRIRGLDDRWAQNVVLRYLQEIHSSNYEPDYEDGLMRLSRLGQRLERGEKCRDLMSFIKQQMYPRYPKFVWNIEVDMGELNYNLLNNLSQIANENLIVIVNTLGPLEFEAGLIGSQMGYGGCPNQTGHQILHKYIWFEDLIQAD